MLKNKVFKYLLALFFASVLLIIFFNNKSNSSIPLPSPPKKNLLYLSGNNPSDEINYFNCEKTKSNTLYLYDGKVNKFKSINLNKTIQKTKKMALLIYPSADHNNAFKHSICKKTFAKVNNDFHLFLVKPSNIFQLKNAISDFHQLYGSIDCLWIQGHGQKENLKINYQENFNYKTLTTSTIDLLSPQAKIFLDSCNTGKKGGLAQKLSVYAKNRKVYAATQKAYGKLVDFQNGEFKFKNLRRKNITVCYQNGINIA